MGSAAGEAGAGMIAPVPASVREVLHPAIGAPRALVASDDRRGMAFVVLMVLPWLASPVLGFRFALVTLTLLAFAAAVAGIWRPATGLHGIVVLCVLDSISRTFVFTGGLLRYNTFNYWLLLALVLYLPLLWRHRNSQLLLAMALVGLLGVELLMSNNLVDGIEQTLNALSVLPLTIYFARVVNRPAVWYWVGVQAGVLAASTGFAYQLSKASLPPINANAFATFGITALFAICLAYRSVGRRPNGQPILLALAATALLWIFLSGSRGNMLIGLCCALFLLLATRGVGIRVVGVSMALLISVAILSAYPVLMERSIGRVVKLADPTRSLSNRTSGRSDLVIGGWKIFSRHPLGVGTGSFPRAWRDMSAADPTITFARGAEKSAHAGWVKVLVENGIPGILLLLAYVGSFALTGWRRSEPFLRRLGLLTSAALGAAWLTTEFQPKGLWFLAAGASVLLAQGHAWQRARPVNHPGASSDS